VSRGASATPTGPLAEGGAATASPAKPSVPSAFTKGPWEAVIDPYEDDPFPGKDYVRVFIGEDNISGVARPEDARLIAAAPELHAAALAAYAVVDGDRFPDVVVQLHSALLKVRGETGASLVEAMQQAPHDFETPDD
jgi:hypothetical protein